MKLTDLLNGVDIVRIVRTPHRQIERICSDSRTCTPGSLFIAVKGPDADGHRYIDMAVRNGAQVVVCRQADTLAEDCTYVFVQDDRQALARIAGNFYGHPSRKLNLVGVTGTNGKTTIATLLYQLFTRLGYHCGLISTIANYIGPRRYETANTTPGVLELNALLARMAEEGCEYCFMEVSSHALDQGRTDGLHFRGGIFTNLTHDHLDYHKTFAAYLRCKKKFFDTLPADAFALINLDDRNGRVMVQNTPAGIHTYSCRQQADFKTKVIEKTIEGMLLNLNGTEVWCPFIGLHNAANLTAVYGAALLLGAPQEETLTGMSRLLPVAGRLQYFKGGRDIVAAVDYAHTPDALKNVLKTLKELGPQGELICVFGCGGNRDTSKRPEMGAVAGKYATRIIVTSDNPRFEDPGQIIRDIKAGMDISVRARSLFISDRAEAIRTAILTAPAGSFVLVAGKGHEDYQIIGGVKHHFDDAEIIAETFARLEGGTAAPKENEPEPNPR